MAAARKIVVIGLDGADWRLLRPWMASGTLPTLQRLVEEGVHGRLHSTIRPESSVAWSTFATGVNPGKHGVFGFARNRPGSYDFHLADSRHVAARRFWDYLGDAGYRVGLVNIPFTYPPTSVNGFLIGGMLTPGSHVNFTHPPALQPLLLQRFNNKFLFDAGDNVQEKGALVEHVVAYTQQQLQTALWLLEEAWDCFTIVFTGPDRLQHFLWADMDSQHSDHQPENAHPFGDALHLYFQTLDHALAQILTHLPEDTLVLIVSDHGFNGVGRRFYINRWLQEQGFLALHDRPDAVGAILPHLSFLKRSRLAKLLKQRLLPGVSGPAQLQTAAFTQSIDWTNTKAYYAPDGGLRINMKGREIQGIVTPAEYEPLRQELAGRLRGLVDPTTGQHPIAEVYLREQLYHGPFLSHAPDLIVEPHRDQLQNHHNYLLDTNLKWKDFPFTSAAPYSGNHAPDGILIGWGQSVAVQKELTNCHLMDIAPTILAAMGVAIPDQIDGKVLLELFADEYRPEPTFYTAPNWSPVSDTVEKGDGDMDTAVANRLRNLGYLD